MAISGRDKNHTAPASLLAPLCRRAAEAGHIRWWHSPEEQDEEWKEERRRSLDTLQKREPGFSDSFKPDELYKGERRWSLEALRKREQDDSNIRWYHGTREQVLEGQEAPHQGLDSVAAPILPRDEGQQQAQEQVQQEAQQTGADLHVRENKHPFLTRIGWVFLPKVWKKTHCKRDASIPVDVNDPNYG